MTADLIRKLEEASEGSRELDAQILQYIDPKNEKKDWFADGKTGEPTPLPGSPYYTTSIDAAFTLVPEGYTGSVTFGQSTSSSNIQFHESAELWNGEHGESCQEIYSKAATPALALCIAALKTREEPHG